MAIKVLVADDSGLVRDAMRKVIGEDPRIEIVGEAATFGQAVQAIADLKPEVLLLDLHLAEKHDFLPALIKSQLAAVDHILAISFSNDAEATELAESYGAKLLLDKMKLYNELVPAILDCGPKANYFKDWEVTSERLQAD